MPSQRLRNLLDSHAQAAVKSLGSRRRQVKLGHPSQYFANRREARCPKDSLSGTSAFCTKERTREGCVSLTHTQPFLAPSTKSVIIVGNAVAASTEMTGQLERSGLSSTSLSSSGFSMAYRRFFGLVVSLLRWLAFLTGHHSRPFSGFFCSVFRWPASRDTLGFAVKVHWR